jgi:Xaa-Pro aminopeptidase
MQPYHDRRQRLAQLIRARGGGVAVIATAPEVIRNRDAHYPYRWDSYFYYLTGFTEPDAVLVLSVDSSGAESLLLCRDKKQ